MVYFLDEFETGKEEGSGSPSAKTDVTDPVPLENAGLSLWILR